ncbi:MAG: hypothetical protein HOL55_12350 [Nitrospina sp.]|nr:hypothetical protein [Nitrospina sp.]
MLVLTHSLLATLRTQHLFNPPCFTSPFQRLILLLLLMTISFSGVSHALEADSSEKLPPYLFMAADNTDDIQARQSQTIVRSRFANVDFSLLPDPEENFDAEPGAEIKLILNFFPEIELTTLIHKIEKNRSGSYSWYGKLEDIPMSQVVLVVNQNKVFGNISKSNLTYQVRHTKNGIHTVYELNPSKFPPDGEPVTPKIPPSIPSNKETKDTDDATKLSLSNKDTNSNQDPFTESGIGYGTMGDAPLSGVTASPDTLENSGSSNISNPETQADDGTVIDVLVVYTAEARAAEGGTSSIESLIDLSISVTNSIYSNSGVDHVLRLVGRQEISFSESSFSFTGFLSAAQNGSIPGLHDLRDSVGADVVAVLVEGNNSLCGIAGLMTTVSSAFAPFAYSVTQTNCTVGNLTMAHEIGHNMAARHDRANDNTNGAPFSFNHGYVDNVNSFRTVMGTGNNSRISNFSNPNVLFGGAVTGISEGNILAADNRLTFQNTALTVSNFRQSIDSPANQAFASIVPFSNTNRVTSPYWQSDGTSYSFIAVTHPSLSSMASQIGVVVRAIKNDGTLFGSATSFTVSNSVTSRIFIVRSSHPSINSTSLTDVNLITGNSSFQHGFLHLNPVASNPEISVDGFRDITRLSFWGAVVVENSTSGFAMEFIGDAHDSAATPSMDDSAPVTGVN